MFCENCGTKLTDGARFCENCGKAVNAAPTAANPTPVTVIPADLPACISINEDGDMQWYYRKKLITHTEDIAVFAKFTVGLTVFMFIAGFLFNDFDLEAAVNIAVMMFIVTGIMMLIGWIGTIIFYGGTLNTVMTLNERKVVYATMPKEAKKTKKLAFFAFLLELFSGDDDFGAASAYALSDSYTRYDSDFADVKSIQRVKRHDLIKVNNVLQRNTIYVPPEAYEFVWNYIKEHCPNAKVK